MAKPKVKRETVTIATTNADNTLAWTAPQTPIAGVVHIMAFDNTSLAQGDSKRWSRAFTGMIGSEGSPQRVDSTDFYTPDGDAGASGWSIEVQDNGSDKLEINVIGELTTDITWTLLIDHWDPT